MQKEFEESEHLCLYYLKKSLREMPRPQNVEPKNETLERYIGWAQRQKDQPDKIPSGRSDFYEHYSEYAGDDQDPAGEIYKTIGEHLSPIIRGELNPLDLLVGSSRLEAFYSGATFAVSYNMLAAYVALMAHQSPDLKMLELGAGTGGATTYVLESITSQAQSQIKALECRQYVYTDISPGFFEAAKNRFRAYEGKMSFLQDFRHREGP